MSAAGLGLGMNGKLAESPVVKRTLARQFTTSLSNQALFWGLFNFLLAALMMFEIFISDSAIAQLCALTHPWIWYIECTLAVIFTFNSLVDFVNYLGPLFVQQPIELTTEQFKLLGVKENSPGFKKSLQCYEASNSPADPKHLIRQGARDGSPHSVTHSPLVSYMMSPATASPSSPFSPGNYQSGNLSSSFHLTPNHMSFNSTTLPGSVSPLMQAGGGTTFSPVLKPDGSGSGLRSRHHQSLPPSPPLSYVLTPEEGISDVDTLNHYLKSYEEKEQNNQLGGAESSPNGSPSFWSFNRSSTDYTPVLRKYQYQVASRSPQSPGGATSKDDDPTFHIAGYTHHPSSNLWPLVIPRDDVDRWIGNLRKWISQTILVRLVGEINKINNSLKRLGSAELQIGDVGISSLRQVVFIKGSHIPSLQYILPYLDITANQEYLVWRIRELAKGGSMSEFHWNGGGNFKGRKWDSDLPTDCSIVMHLLCTYLDSRLPPDPKYPDGKTFASQYFLKIPDKPDIKKNKGDIRLYQTKINPPHYKVIIGEDLWDVHKGHSNIFQAILFFLFRQEHGMLGRVNLGPSGINILWVLDS